MSVTVVSSTEKPGPASMLTRSVCRSVAAVPSPSCVMTTSASVLTACTSATTCALLSCAWMLLAMFATVALAAPTSACTESLPDICCCTCTSYVGVPDSARRRCGLSVSVALQPADTGLPQADSSTIAWSWAWVSAEPS